MAGVPAPFQPLVLRGAVKFRSLRRHKLRASEKQWLCEYIDGAHGEQAYLDRSVEAVSHLYHLPEVRVEHWMRVYRHGAAFVDGCERGVRVDEIGLLELKLFLELHCGLTPEERRPLIDAVSCKVLRETQARAQEYW
jgi:hypothetical protein